MSVNKVEGRDHLVKDSRSQSVSNTDRESYESARRAKKRILLEKAQREKLETQVEDLTKRIDQLTKIVEKITGE